MDIYKKHLEEFESLWGVFSKTNSQINLSAIRDKEGFFEKHVQDSLLVCDFFDEKFQSQDAHKLKVLDLGSGGGFPMLPLAVVYPDVSFMGLDSVGKKMRAVQAMADEMKLTNIETAHGRFEDMGHHPQFRSQFDMVVARAVAPWNVLLEYALPFVKQGGVFIAYQGPEILEELGFKKNDNMHSSSYANGVNSSESYSPSFSGIEKKLGGRIGRIEKTTLGEATRVFIEVNKVSPMPNRYPRENGVPRKDPLG